MIEEIDCFQAPGRHGVQCEKSSFRAFLILCDLQKMKDHNNFHALQYTWDTSQY